MKNIMLVVPKLKEYSYEAKLEDENDSLDDWRKVHINYFSKIDKNFNYNTKVVFEIFEVIRIWK